MIASLNRQRISTRYHRSHHGSLLESDLAQVVSYCFCRMPVSRTPCLHAHAYVHEPNQSFLEHNSDRNPKAALSTQQRWLLLHIIDFHTISAKCNALLIRKGKLYCSAHTAPERNPPCVGQRSRRSSNITADKAEHLAKDRTEDGGV